MVLCIPIIVKNIDLIGHLSSNIAFWGFTAAIRWTSQSTHGFTRMDDNSICVVDATFPVTVGNNYHTSSGVASLTNGDYQYFVFFICEWILCNTAYPQW